MPSSRFIDGIVEFHARRFTAGEYVEIKRVEGFDGLIFTDAGVFIEGGILAVTRPLGSKEGAALSLIIGDTPPDSQVTKTCWGFQINAVGECRDCSFGTQFEHELADEDNDPVVILNPLMPAVMEQAAKRLVEVATTYNEPDLKEVRFLAIVEQEYQWGGDRDGRYDSTPRIARFFTIEDLVQGLAVIDRLPQ